MALRPRSLASVLVALALGACRGDDDGGRRPDVFEKRRRALLVMEALDLETPAGDLGRLGCFFDEPDELHSVDEAGRPPRVVNLAELVAPAVIACSTDEWSRLPDAFARVYGVDVEDSRRLIDAAAAALGESST